MADSKAELDDAVPNLDRHFGELKQAAAERLGQLFNPADYPESLVGLFDVAWDFPSFEPPDYLRQLCPAVYEQERARVAARFDEAVQLAEQAFLEEFARLVAHLCERIAGTGEDGQPRVFRDSAVDNLSEFFGRFRELNVRRSEQLDELVERARRAVRGVAAQDLRDSEALRQRVASQLAQVQSSLDGDAGRAAAAARSCGRRPRRGRRDAPGHRRPTAASGRSTARRSTWPPSAAPRSPAPATSSPTATAAGRPTCGPVGGPVLGPFGRRSEALEAERAWLEANWLTPSS